MSIGESDREIFLSINIQQSFVLCCNTADQIGRLQESNQVLNMLIVKTRYGFQSVKLRINLCPHEGGTMVSIQGASDDIWGGGARRGIDKFVAALSEQTA
ncbi:MAG: hypothetical protein WC390_06605 [Sulfurimonas sp.]|jgi:hypothetical protein